MKRTEKIGLVMIFVGVNLLLYIGINAINKSNLGNPVEYSLTLTQHPAILLALAGLDTLIGGLVVFNQ